MGNGLIMTRRELEEGLVSDRARALGVIGVGWHLCVWTRATPLQGCNGLPPPHGAYALPGATCTL